VAAIRRALDDLAAGEPHLLLLEGPAGIGKTRLLAEARRQAAERGLGVLSARGSQLERAFGFGAVRQLFEPALVDPGRRDQLLAGSATSARTVFDLVGDDKADGSFAVLHGLYWLTVNLAGDRPLVLAVDDVQWCDSASLRYLAYLVRRLEGLPVLVVATLRTGERHDDEDLLAELALDPATVAIRPGPLSPEGTEELVRQRLGEPAPLFVTACHRTTSGNPLLLRQLLRALEADAVSPDAAHADRVMAVGSRAISSMVLVRLRRMPPDVTAVARAVAVLGEGARLTAVSAFAGLDDATAAAALAALTRAGDPARRAAGRLRAPPGARRDLPRAAGSRARPAARAARPASSRTHGASDEQVAAHLLVAPPRGDAGTVAVLRAAGRTAADRGASDSAVTYLRRALAEPAEGAARVDTLIELGLVESLLDGPASVEHLGAAYAELTDPARLGEIAITIARTHVFTSPPGVAPAFARDAAAALPDDLVDPRQGLLALQRISAYMQAVDPAEWRAGPQPEVVGRGNGARMLAATLSWEAVCDGVDRARAVELARFALEGDRLWQVDNGLLWVVAALSRMTADDDLGDFWGRARAEAHARGSLFAAMSVSLWEGYAQWRRGELAEAVASFEAALEQDRMWGGSGVGTTFTQAFLVGVHLDRGDLGAARGVADAALAAPLVGDGGRLLGQAAVRLQVAEGRHAEALAALDSVVDPVQVPNPVWNPVRSLRALALAGVGRTPEAIALASEEVELLRRWGAPTYLGAGLRLLGELSGGAGLESPAGGGRRPRADGGSGRDRPRTARAGPVAGRHRHRGRAAAAGGGGSWATVRGRGGTRRGVCGVGAPRPGGRLDLRRRPGRVDDDPADPRPGRGRARRQRGGAAAVPHAGHGPHCDRARRGAGVTCRRKSGSRTSQAMGPRLRP
jgi:tetratricopeptide (TPR) repeat protein